ncbi:hypothetical protein GE09DRAFT_689296 [Coniochaeta sp. 2T2.1]|nr:hypothetical protein GE09DRAFT_689296 [Coniochaeta sp. 2T2.1]
MDLVDPVAQLLDPVFVCALRAGEPLHSISVLPRIAVKRRPEDPKHELVADQRQGVVPDGLLVARQVWLRPDGCGVQIIAVVQRQGARRGDLLDCHILRLAVPLELDREVGTGNPVSDKGTILDLKAVPRIEALQRQPVRTVRPDVPRPLGLARAVVQERGGGVRQWALSCGGQTSWSIRSACQHLSSDTTCDLRARRRKVSFANVANSSLHRPSPRISLYSAAAALASSSSI